MSYNITAAAVPASERKANPFDEAVAALVKSWDDDKGTSAEAFAVTVPADEVDKVKGLVQEAGRHVGKSARVSVETKGKNATLTCWLREKITRPRKSAENAESAPSAASAE